MSAYRILVLTDHHTHGPGESIYELLRTMALSSECKEIYLANRGILKNRLFFENFDTPTVYARRVDNDLQYSDDGRRKLSEVNTLDVNGFLQAQELSGTPVIKNSSAAIWKYIVENV